MLKPGFYFELLAYTQKFKCFLLQDYIAVKEKNAKYLPHSAGRYAAKRFRKAQCPIVERLTNSLMMHGRNNGKKLMAVRIVKHAFEIIHLLTGEVQCLVLYFVWFILSQIFWNERAMTWTTPLNVYGFLENNLSLVVSSFSLYFKSNLMLRDTLLRTVSFQYNFIPFLKCFFSILFFMYFIIF